LKFSYSIFLFGEHSNKYTKSSVLSKFLFTVFVSKYRNLFVLIKIIKFKLFFFKNIFLVPHLATCIFLFFYNEPELGVGIGPGMALTPLPSSIGQGSNSQPSDCEPSALPLDHSFRFKFKLFFLKVY